MLQTQSLPLWLTVALLGLAPATSTLAATPDVIEPKDALAAISKEVLRGLEPQPAGGKAPDAVAKASDQVKANLNGKSGRYKFTFGSVTKFNDKDWLMGEMETVRVSNVEIRVRYMALLNPADVAKASKFRKGDRITAEGNLSGLVTWVGGHPMLNLEMHNTKLN